jgi:hypothetical protein
MTVFLVQESEALIRPDLWNATVRVLEDRAEPAIGIRLAAYDGIISLGLHTDKWRLAVADRDATGGIAQPTKHQSVVA